MWRDWVAWQGRLEQLGVPGESDSGPHIATRIPYSSPLAHAWRRLPRIPLVLEAMHGGNTLRLRYAALYGTYVPMAVADADSVGLAFDLISSLTGLVDSVAMPDRAPFTDPHAYVDFNGQARIAFAEPSADADLREVGFVKAFARMFGEIVDLGGAPKKDPLFQLVQHCKHGAIVELRAVRKALRGLSKESHVPWIEPAWNAWCELERIVGYDLVGNPKKAAELARDNQGTWSQVARAIIDELGSGRTWEWHTFRSDPVEPPRAPPRVDIASLDQTHEYARAIAFLLHKDRRTDAEQLVLARCYLALRHHEPALLHVRRTANSAARFAIEVEALLALRRNDELLVAADAWLALAPDEPRAHNARAHALLALGRAADARAAHDRAAQLGSLPSQFARTNLDRTAKQLRIVAGSEGYRELPVPAHLQDLVPLLSQGRLLDAILWLTDRYADPEARALLATCYEYAGDPDSALHVHEADANTAGIARCLIALGRRDEAFARAGNDAALLDELRELAGLPAERIAWNR